MWKQRQVKRNKLLRGKAHVALNEVVQISSAVQLEA